MVIKITPELLEKLSPSGDFITPERPGEFEARSWCLLPYCTAQRPSASVKFATDVSMGWYICYHCKVSTSPIGLICKVLRISGRAAKFWYMEQFPPKRDPLRRKGGFQTPDADKKRGQSRYGGDDDLFHNEWREVF